MNAPKSGVQINRKGGKKGLSFVKETDWNAIKGEGDWSEPTLKKIIDDFDLYFKTIKDRDLAKSTPKKIQFSESLLLSADTKNAHENGEFIFLPDLAKPFDYFNESTPFDKDIDQWLTKTINKAFLEQQMECHDYVYCNNELGLKTFASNNAIKLARGCQEIFWPWLLEEIQNSYVGFKVMPETIGVGPNAVPDYSVSLLHKTGTSYIVTQLQEEKTGTEKIDAAGPQITKYCQALLHKDYNIAYCLLYAQKTKQIRLVKFIRATHETKSFDQLIEYSLLLPLLSPLSGRLDPQLMRLMFKVSLKAIYLQLKSLKLFFEEVYSKDFQ